MQKGILKSYDKAGKQFSNGFAKLCNNLIKISGKKSKKTTSSGCGTLFYIIVLCALVMFLIAFIADS